MASGKAGKSSFFSGKSHPSDLELAPRSIVYFDIEVNRRKEGRIIFELVSCNLIPVDLGYVALQVTLL